MNNSTILSTLNKIIVELAKSRQLNFSHPNLPTITQTTIKTSLGDILPNLLAHPSPLTDKQPEINLLSVLIKALDSRKAIKNLDHIGFCYKVNSNQPEKKRLMGLAKENSIDLYQEPSNDDGLWLFTGDISTITNPVLELVPIELTSDTDRDFWLPHIQIDLDTTLNGHEIVSIVKKVYKDLITPFPLVIEGTTYIIRNRLGIVDGVNIFLDLATNSRNVTNLRQKIWQKIA